MSDVLSASLEDYLKAIYRIAREKKAARAKDISARLKVSNASVTGALRSLAERGLVNYAPYDIITLTAAGEAAALDVVRRQEALRDFFVKVLSVDTETAEIGACKMEHEIPPAIVERFIQFLDFVELCPRAGAQWVRGFGYSCRGASEEACRQCIASCSAELQHKPEHVVALSDLIPGQSARLVRLGGRGESRKRLIEQGLVPGAVLAVDSVGTPGDSIEIRIRGYHLSLRKDEAALITVELLGGSSRPGPHDRTRVS